MSFEGGDQAAAVLLQLQDGHLTRLVPHKGVSGLHIEPRLTFRSRKKKLCPPGKLNLFDFLFLSEPKHRLNKKNTEL